MNRILFLATILFAVVYMTAAIPIPESFHQHQLAKRCHTHRSAAPKPSDVPAFVPKNRNIEPVPISSAEAVKVVNDDNGEDLNKMFLPDVAIKVHDIKLPTPKSPGKNAIQATHIVTSSAVEPKATTTTTTSKKPTTTTTTTTSTTSEKPTTTSEKPTTTSEKPTTTSEKPTTTTTSKKPTTTTTEKAAETSSSSNVSFPYSGDGTWYDPGLGSCGITNAASDFIAAMNYRQMDNGANPNNNPNCGRKVQVKGPSGSVTVTITDTCPGCAFGSVDLSPAAFVKIAPLSAGRVPIDWNWIS